MTWDEAIERYGKFARVAAAETAGDAERAVARKKMAELEQAFPGIGTAYVELNAPRKERRPVRDRKASKQKFRDAVKNAVKPTPGAGIGQSILEGVLGWAADKAARRVEKAFEDVPEVLDELADRIADLDNNEQEEPDMAKRTGSNKPKNNPNHEEVSVDQLEAMLDEWEDNGGLDVEVTVEDHDGEDEPEIEKVEIKLEMDGELALACSDHPDVFGAYVLDAVNEAVAQALGEETDGEEEEEDED